MPARLPGVLLALTFPLSAQPHTAALPKVHTGIFGGTNYYLAVAPPQPLRGQYWYRGDMVPNPPVIGAVATRTSPTTNSPSGTWVIELSLSSTPVSFTTLSTTLASNRGPSTTVVFPMQTVSFPAYTPALGPDVPPAWTPLTAPWVFTGPNLLLDYRYGTLATTGSGNVNFDALTMTAGTPTGHWVVGKACGGGAIAASYASGTYTVTASGLPANAPATFMIGTENVWQAGIKLPLDLTPFTITGCELGTWPLINVTLGGTASGTVALPIPYALPASSLVVFTQVLHPTTANPSGFATTKVVGSILGAAGIMNNLLSFDGVTGYQAPSTTNAAPVFLVK